MCQNKGTSLKKSEVVIGATYYAAICRVCSPVKITAAFPPGQSGWRAKNLRTGRSVRIKSARKLYPTKEAWQQARQARLQRLHAQWAKSSKGDIL